MSDTNNLQELETLRTQLGMASKQIDINIRDAKSKIKDRNLTVAANSYYKSELTRLRKSKNDIEVKLLEVNAKLQGARIDSGDAYRANVVSRLDRLEKKLDEILQRLFDE